MLTPMLLVAASLAWPTGAVARLRRFSGAQRRRRWPSIPAQRLALGAALAASGVAGAVVLGPAGGAMGVLAASVGARRMRARRSARRDLAEARGMAEALGGLVAELRAGVHPVAAAASVTDEAEPGGAASRGLRAIATSARLGGEADAALLEVAAAGLSGADPLRRVARAWRLAQEHGLPLADALDAVRRDLEASSRFTAQLHAKLAGPRASAAVLAGLPGVGILLGEGMGAAPLSVLSSTPAGQLLLVVGSSFVLAGVGWSGHLTRRAVAG